MATGTVGLIGTRFGQCTLTRRSIHMSIGDKVRKALFMSGLLSITLSLMLDAHFATDATVAVPGPGTLALLAVGGVSAIAVALIRRRKK